MAAATAAAAEAAVATAKAAVEFIRLTQPSSKAGSLKQHGAARVIQTAFRGYLVSSCLVGIDFCLLDMEIYNKEGFCCWLLVVLTLVKEFYVFGCRLGELLLL